MVYWKQPTPLTAKKLVSVSPAYALIGRQPEPARMPWMGYQVQPAEFAAPFAGLGREAGFAALEWWRMPGHLHFA